MPDTHPTRAALESTQLEHLRSLLAELIPANRFYTRKLNDLGITFDVASLEDFSARFPFTTKSELVADQRAHPPFGSNLTYPLDRYTRFHQTSGTTATPLRWLDTPESWDHMVANWTEILITAGVTARDRLYFAFSFGPFIGFWLAFEAAARMGCLCVPGGGLSSVARLQAILDNGITVLSCTPTYALRLAEVAGQEKIQLAQSSVRTLIVAGEPGGSIPAMRARLATAWPNTQIFDHHGMTEVGPVTYQCPHRPGVLHIIESAFFAEVIHPVTGNPQVLGQTGELVLTTLGRIASPLLRYRTGDLVRAPAHSEFTVPCLCGRWEMALEGGILGRVDDMVVVRGVNVYPCAIEDIVRSFDEVAEYVAEFSVTHSLPELRLQIEPRSDCADVAGLVHRLALRFESALSLRVPVQAVPPGALQRSEMKSRRWVKR